MTKYDELVKYLNGPVLEHAQRLIDRAFGNDRPLPQLTIPADPERDSDLIVSRGIQEAAAAITELEADLASALEALRPFATGWKIASYLLRTDHCSPAHLNHMAGYHANGNVYKTAAAELAKHEKKEA